MGPPVKPEDDSALYDWGSGARWKRSSTSTSLASARNGTLYIGVTSNLVKRVWEHREGVVPGFTRTYGVHRLVWFEQHATAESAIRRENRLKTWLRKWKIELIEATNPHWDDLYNSIAQP